MEDNEAQRVGACHLIDTVPWHFERLQNVTYWRQDSSYSVFETLFLQVVKPCTTNALVSLSAVGTPNICKLIDILIQLPPLENVELCHIDYEDEDDNRKRSLALVQLFKSYVARTNLFKQKLRSVLLQECNFISTNVLDALGEIKTLEEVDFYGACTIPSSEHLRHFLQKVDNHLLELMLKDISHVDDNLLRMLSQMKKLQLIKLQGIKKITEVGIKYLVDNAKRLRSLTLVDCIALSYPTRSHINKRIKNVKIY